MMLFFPLAEELQDEDIPQKKPHNGTTHPCAGLFTIPGCVHVT